MQKFKQKKYWDYKNILGLMLQKAYKKEEFKVFLLNIDSKEQRKGHQYFIVKQLFSSTNEITRTFYRKTRFLRQLGAEAFWLSEKQLYYIMSGVDKMLGLRELHLIPHFVYLVGEVEVKEEFSLQIWKDETSIGEIKNLISRAGGSGEKWASLRFDKIRLQFDVEALFDKRTEATVRLKLKVSGRHQPFEEFKLHILFYSYELNRGRFVRFRENSVGGLKHYILNYSFSAVYGEKLDSLFRNEHSFLQDIPFLKKDSKYGLILQDSARPINTIMLIEAVASHGASAITQQSPLMSMAMKMNEQIDEDIVQNARKATRSIYDDVAFKTDQSHLGDSEQLKSLKERGRNASTLFLLILGFYLIYMLMHPLRKI